MRKTLTVVVALAFLAGAATMLLVRPGVCSAGQEATGQVGRYQLVAGSLETRDPRSAAPLESHGLFRIDTTTGRVWKLSVSVSLKKDQPESIDKITRLWIPQDESE